MFTHIRESLQAIQFNLRSNITQSENKGRGLALHQLGVNYC